MKKCVGYIGFILVLIAGTSQLNAQSTTVYTKKTNWAITPASYTTSLKNLIVDSTFTETDVFYVYPTLFTDKNDTNWNIAIEDKNQRDQVLEVAVKNQASTWANAGQLYVPYYRQAHIRSYSHLEGRGRAALMLAYADVKAAFEYYLEHYNNGRAIILAGHSQGSTHLTLLLKDFFDGKPLQHQLVAAYLPGIGIQPNEFKTIPLLTHPDSTGGYVTWNTFKKNYKTRQYLKWYKGMASINPVSWDTSAITKRSMHKGFLNSNGKMYAKSFETHLIDGGIWITTPRFPGRYMSFLMDNYHIGDVNLFWEDIRMNARNRAEQFWASKSD